MSGNISLSEVDKIAKLANLKLSPEEEKQLSQMLSETLDYIAILDELDLSNVKETLQVTGLINVYREQNFPKTGLDSFDALRNAKLTKDSKIGVPVVLPEKSSQKI